MQDRQTDRHLLEQAMAKVEDLQTLATKYGIDDIFQDNGGKVLQSLIILGLKQAPGREGNDALDELGREYELKTVNVLKNKQVTTHHHLNLVILDKYRKVGAWYISLYEGIKLQSIYRVETADLELFFAQWEAKIHAAGKPLNNPKIPVSYVTSHGRVVHIEKPSALATPSPDTVAAETQQSLAEAQSEDGPTSSDQ